MLKWITYTYKKGLNCFYNFVLHYKSHVGNNQMLGKKICQQFCYTTQNNSSFLHSKTHIRLATLFLTLLRQIICSLLDANNILIINESANINVRRNRKNISIFCKLTCVVMRISCNKKSLDFFLMFSKTVMSLFWKCICEMMTKSIRPPLTSDHP